VTQNVGFTASGCHIQGCSKKKSLALGTPGCADRVTVPNVTSRVGGQRALDRSALPRAIPGLSFAGWRGSDEDRYIFTLPSIWRMESVTI